MVPNIWKINEPTETTAKIISGIHSTDELRYMERKLFFDFLQLDAHVSLETYTTFCNNLFMDYYFNRTRQERIAITRPSLFQQKLLLTKRQQEEGEQNLSESCKRLKIANCK